MKDFKMPAGSVGTSSTGHGGKSGGSKAKYASARRFPDLPVEKHQKMGK